MARYSPPEVQHNTIRLAEVLAALSLATDLGAGRSMGHAMRACIIGMRMADELRLSGIERIELYYSFLLMHSGCSVLSSGMAPAIQGDELAAFGDAALRDETNMLDTLDWMRTYVSPHTSLPMRALNVIGMMLQFREGVDHLRGACEVAVQVAQRLGMPEGVQEAVRYYLERWDGKGPFGLGGSAIPLKSRLLQLALKMEAVYTAYGRDKAQAMALEQKGKTFDPQIVDIFLFITQNDDLWEILAQEDLLQIVLDLEPDSPYQNMPETKLDDIALAVADFVDIKTPLTVGHSRETARIAEGIARRMGAPSSEVANIRRAALVHDLGLIAVPGSILLNQGRLSEADKEKLRLHPYYTERILSRVPALGAVALIAGKHHERLNGTGYHRGLSGDDLPLGACVLALTEEFQERLQTRQGQPGLDPKDVLKAMQPDVGTLFSPECFQALAQEMGVAASKPPRRHAWPGGLTDREVEVLQLVSRGASNRQVARELVVSEKTVAHHLEHIYNKIGVSSRAAAVFFAMEHELIN
jgi:HD-GYP domain-containing protein (c-di-GMP phosphodiesterase class II)